MMSYGRVSHLALLFLIATGISFGATSADKIKIRVVVVNPAGSPVEILGWREVADQTKGPEVIVKNVSRQAISHFALATRASRAENCAVSSTPEHSTVTAGLKLEPASLSPGKSAISGSDLLNRGSLLTYVPELMSREVTVRLYVAKVVFTDGTVWTAQDVDIGKPTGDDCSGAVAFAASPLNTINLRLVRSRPVGNRDSNLLSKEWVLTCTTAGEVASCE